MKTKKLLVCIAFLLGFAVSMRAANLDGKTCSTAYPLNGDYPSEVSANQTIWYSAWTFDLPLAVYFIPKNGKSDPPPEAEMDFTCIPGVYTDPIIATLTTMIKLPYKVEKVEEGVYEGQFAYIMSVGKRYRDLLFGMGVDYNLEAFVKVTYKSAGTVGIAPDGLFSSCMDEGKILHIGDSLKIKPNDDSTYYIAPYVKWKTDSIRYIWKGDKPCRIAVATKCDFDPNDNSIDEIVQFTSNSKRLQPPCDTLNVTSAELTKYVNSDEKPSEAGMFFAKFYSASSGGMKIERIPMDPPKEGATLLKYDNIVNIEAKDTSSLFAIHKSYTQAMKFITPSNRIFRMYVSNDPKFQLKDAIASYQFLRNTSGHWLGLLEDSIKALWKQTSEQYLYIRFESSIHTTLLLTQWTPSECITSWTLIPKGESTLTIAKGSYKNVYRRLNYYDWRGGDMTLTWNSSAVECPVFIGNTCDFQPDENDEHVIDFYTIPQQDEWIITAERIDSWEEKVDVDGCLYMLCNPSRQGEMVVSTTAPDEMDPIYPRATISVKCEEGTTNNLVVRVSEKQKISIKHLPGMEVLEEWDNVVFDPGEEKTLHLDAGQYLLQGEKEQITVLIP